MTTPYTPGADDIAIQMLRDVFGKAINGILGGSPAGAESAAANMLGTAFGFFNGGVLFFGAIFLTWMTVFGITNTANDGEVLGKKWSTFYTPLRTFTASAFLIPSSSGYSVIQLTILLIVTWSVGFASNMWGKVVDYGIASEAVEQAVASIQEDTNFDQLAYNALRMQVCAHSVTQGINQTMGPGTVAFVPLHVNSASRVTAPSDPAIYTTTVVLKDIKWGGSEDICGKLVLTSTYAKPDTNASAAQDVAVSVRNAINTIRFKYALSLLDPNGGVAGIAKQIAQVADSTGQTISAQSVNDQIVALRGQMMKEITEEVRKQVSNESAGLANKFKGQGWAMAGSLHRELSQIKDSIRSATTSKTEYIAGSGNTSHLLTAGVVTTAVQGVMARYDMLTALIIQKGNPNSYTASTTGKPVMPSLQASFTVDDFTDGGASIKSKITAWYNRIPDSVMRGLVFYLAKDGSDPVMQVKNIGDWMATFAETAMLTKALVASSLDGLVTGMQAASQQQIAGFSASGLAAPVIGFAKYCLRLVSEMWALISPGIMTLLYGGYFLGIWIPMIPYYVFTLGVIGWLVQVVESLAAGSLWTVMHLTPEKNDSFIGSQQQGYLLLMSLFARPPLMVLGLVASMAILTPAVQFVNTGFITAFRVIQADSVTGLLSLSGFMLIYGVIIFGVFMMVFSLPQTLPDRILRWVGAGIGDLGEQNTMGRIESGASGQAKAAVVAGAAGLARRDQDRKRKDDEARRANAHGRNEADGARPEGHT